MKLVDKNSDTLFELDEALSFFESDAFDTFQDIGDIWGTEESLSWEMELDAEFFAELGEDSGLPVERPEPEKERLSIPELVLAVREKTALMSEAVGEDADQEVAAAVLDIDEALDASDVEDDLPLVADDVDVVDAGATSAPSFAPTGKTSVPVWDFDAFEKRSKPQLPPRRGNKVDSDFGLLDLLGEKSGRSEPDAPKAPQGSSAPKFANVTVPPRKAPAGKRVSKKRSVKKSIPEGSLTGLLFGDEGESKIFGHVDSSEVFVAEAVEFSSPQTDDVEEQAFTGGLPLEEENTPPSSDALSGFFGEGGHFGGDLEDEPLPKSSYDVLIPEQKRKESEELVLSDEKETFSQKKSLKKVSSFIQLDVERKERTISQADTMLRHFKSNDW